MIKAFATAVALSPVLMAPVFTSAAMAETATVSVTAQAEGDITLPEGSLLGIELLDVSRADAPSTIVSSVFMQVSALPVTLDVPYDTSMIDDRMSYTVSGSVMAGDGTVYHTTSAAPVITRDAGDSVTITLDGVITPQEAPAPVSDPLGANAWTAYEIGGRMLVTDDAPTLTLMPDGTFSLYAGCNRYMGQADIADGAFVVAQPMAGTRMYCGDRMALEQTTLEAFEASVGYLRTGDQLVLVNEAGLATMRFNETPE